MEYTIGQEVIFRDSHGWRSGTITGTTVIEGETEIRYKIEAYQSNNNGVYIYDHFAIPAKQIEQV